MTIPEIFGRSDFLAILGIGIDFVFFIILVVCIKRVESLVKVVCPEKSETAVPVAHPASAVLVDDQQIVAAIAAALKQKN